MRTLILISAAVIGSVPLLAQASAVAPPRLALTYDSSSGGFRPIMGIPGASVVGVAGGVGFAIRDAQISSDQSFALVRSADDNALAIVQWTGARSLSRRLSGNADAYALAPSGRSAAFYSRENGAISVFTGLPQAPRLRYRFDFSLPNLTSLAISDDGALAVATVSDEGGRSLWAVGRGMQPLRLALAGTVAAFAFNGSAHDGVAVAAEGLVAIARIDSDPVYVQWPLPEAVLNGAIAVRAGANRAVLLSSTGLATVVDTTNGRFATASCDCSPDGFWPTALPSVFHVASTRDARSWLFDTSAPDPKMWFVPAGKTATEQQQ